MPRPKVCEIDRIDGLRVLTVQANVAEGVLVDDKVKEIGALLAAAPIPAGGDRSFKGQDEEQRQAQAFLTRASGVALFIMAVILVDGIEAAVRTGAQRLRPVLAWYIYRETGARDHFRLLRLPHAGAGE